MNIDFYLVIGLLVWYFITRLIKKDNKDSIFLIGAFAIFYIVLIFRKPISDMEFYLNKFHEIQHMNVVEMWLLTWEKLYILLNKIMGLFICSDRGFIIITSFIGLIGPYYFIKKYSKNYLIGVILFVVLGLYSYNFFIIRQTIAISIILFGMKYIEEKKFPQFLIITIIGTLFHKTTILFLLIYFIGNKKVEKKYLLQWSVILVATFLLKDFIMNQIYKIVYSNYIGRYGNSNGYERLILFATILIVATYLYSRVKNSLDNKENNIITITYNMMLLTILFQIIATSQPTVARIANVFAYGIILLIPNLIEKVEHTEYKKILQIGLICGTILYSILFPTITEYALLWA